MADIGTSEPVRAFSRQFQVDQIPAGGLNDRIEASAEERAAVAELLGLESLSSLNLAFELKPAEAKRFAVIGRLQARLEQICVVTLEAIRIDVDRAIELKFVSEKELLRRRESEEDELSDPAAMDLEPFEGGVIDLGQLAYEYLATQIEPYPRKPGIDFEWEPAGTPGAGEDDGPFSALKVLKEK